MFLICYHRTLKLHIHVHIIMYVYNIDFGKKKKKSEFFKHINSIKVLWRMIRWTQL